MKVNKYHIFFWLAYSTEVMFFDYLFLQKDFRFLRELIVIVMQIWTMYSFLFFLSKFNIKNLRGTLRSVGLLLLSISILFFLNEIRAKLAIYYGYKLFDSFKWYVYDTLNFIINYSLYSIGLFYLIRANDSKRKLVLFENDKMILENKNTQIKNKLQQSELNFLRAQINPHFLQNCLNFIYSDTRKTNPNAADAILLLSNIMRYSVADNSATGGMTLLTDEITQVANVIQIHQLRFEQKLKILFNKEGNFEHKQIVPMILLTLVENLIKYGDLNNSQYPAKIECTINEMEKKIFFTTSNKKAYATEIISTGLGLKNIRERLALIWNDSFTLQKEETDDWYTVKLCMPYVDIPVLAKRDKYI
jgi:two-component system, LytTR family, sensor kinase